MPNTYRHLMYNAERSICIFIVLDAEELLFLMLQLSEVSLQQDILVCVCVCVCMCVCKIARARFKCLRLGI